jgi:hypothetical protein
MGRCGGGAKILMKNAKVLVETPKILMERVEDP